MFLFLLFLLPFVCVRGQLFQSILYEQKEEILLPLTGIIPPNINGTLYRNGFGQFEGHDFEFTHLFDALFLVMSFRIQDGKVWSRFQLLDTEYKNQSATRIPPYRTLGGTNPQPKNWIEHGLHDNRNGNIIPYGTSLLAINDMAGGVLLDTKLQTTGYLNPITAIMSSTHPIERYGFIYNYEINALGYYEIFRINNKMVKETIVTIHADQFSYLHSFSMTKQYIIIALYPVTWNITSIFFSESILPELGWTSNETLLYVIDIDTHHIHILSTDPIFSFHHINAYEDQGQDQENLIILDMIVYHNLSCFYDLQLDNLRKHLNLLQGHLDDIR
jgi:carotenoid cleavage dioxygenase-like enzyme